MKDELYRLVAVAKLYLMIDNREKLAETINKMYKITNISPADLKVAQNAEDRQRNSRT